MQYTNRFGELLPVTLKKLRVFVKKRQVKNQNSKHGVFFFKCQVFEILMKKKEKSFAEIWQLYTFNIIS